MTDPTTTRNQRLLLTTQQLNTVLAAMRFWQMAAEAGRVDPNQDSIATDAGAALPLEQYDAFIESINGAGPEHGSLLAAVAPVLRTSDSVEVRLSRVEGALQVLIIPKLGEAKDEEDPGVAAYRALLARPLKAVISGEQDADAALAVLLAEHAHQREQVASDLDEHRKLLEQARTAAQKARDEAAKSAKPAAKPGKSTKPAKGSKPAKATKPTKVATAPTPPADKGPTAGQGSQPTPPPAEPGKGETAFLFTDIGY